jgi:dihydroorotase
MRPVLIQGGRVIDPSRAFDAVADVLLRDGRIEAVEANITAEDAETVDATGKIVAPGLVDVHVHFREPGKEEAETVATGARSAAAGGFTSVCAMPNTDPVTDNQAAVGFIVKQASAANGARVYPYGTISVGQEGEHLAPFAKLIEAGAIAMSDDGHPVRSSHLMRTALEDAQAFGIPVADHCEEPSLAHGAMHEGVVASRLGLRAIPAAAEEIMVARDVILSELTGGHIHLCHMSTRGSVDIIRRAKERGVNVTAEVTPHHLTLTHAECEGFNTNAKMNPPLREEADVSALREALQDGTLDMTATDHAPHHYEAKERDFDEAPFGIVGLETALGLCIKDLVHGGVLSLPELVNRMSTEPARVFHLDAGTLQVGKPGDVVVFDPDATWTVDPTQFYSKSRNTPYAGHALTGRVERTVVGGRTVFERK